MQSTLFPRHWLLAPGLLFMSVFFILPTAFLFYASFQATDSYGNMTGELTIANYTNAFVEDYYRSAIVGTLTMSLQATIVCCIMGYIAAYAIVNTQSRAMKAFLYAIVISPLLTSVIARSFGWIVLLSRGGGVNDLLLALGLIERPLRLLYTGPATVVAVAQVLLPFAVLPMIAVMSSFSKEIQKAAAALGASPLRVFLTVTLPLTLPGVVLGGLLVFVHAMGIYITPLVVGGPNRPLVAVRIYEQVLNYFNMSAGAALSFILLFMTMAVAVVVNNTFRRWSLRRLGT